MSPPKGVIFVQSNFSKLKFRKIDFVHSNWPCKDCMDTFFRLWRKGCRQRRLVIDFRIFDPDNSAYKADNFKFGPLWGPISGQFGPIFDNFGPFRPVIVRVFSRKKVTFLMVETAYLFRLSVKADSAPLFWFCPGLDRNVAPFYVSALAQSVGCRVNRFSTTVFF